VISAQCANCKRVTEFNWNGGNIPERIAKRFQDLGWQFNPRKAKQCICPGCLFSTRGRETDRIHTFPNGRVLIETEAQQRALAVAEVTVPPIAPSRPQQEAHIHAQARAKREKEDVVKATTTNAAPKPHPATPKPIPLNPRTLTADEKSRVRRLLDEHFDDAAGTYLDDYSDQRIGTEIDVPWAAVATMRETAYGPIRENPLVAQIRSDIAEARRRIDEAERKLAILAGAGQMPVGRI